MWRRRSQEPGRPVDERSSDAELLRAVAAEQTEALRLLHQRHSPWLRARLRRRCADPDLVDAALQDTFVAIWTGAHPDRRRAGGIGIAGPDRMASTVMAPPALAVSAAVLLLANRDVFRS